MPTNVKRSMSVASTSDSSQSSASKLVLLIVLLNSADAFLTSFALDIGATEFNPIVAQVLGHGMTAFLFFKLVMVNSMIVFAGFFGYSYPVGRIGLKVASWVYSLLTLWHVVNLSQLFVTGK